MQEHHALTLLFITSNALRESKIKQLQERTEVKCILQSGLFEALEYLIDHSVDIIAFDGELGYETCIEFLEAISSDIENKETPLVIVTPIEEYCRFSALAASFNIISTLSSEHCHLQLANLLALLHKQIKSAKELRSELVQSETRSVIDPLTKAYNRYGAEDKFHALTAKYKAYQENFSLIIMDIDYFKKVNDTYGHDIGDEVLISIATLIQKSIRKKDALIRLGGEEFIVFISNADIYIASKIASNFRQAIEESRHSSKNLAITASFGVAQYRANEDLESLIKRADELLYKAKKTGRNRVVSI